LKGFTELDRGDWCGKTKSEIGEDAMDRFDACDESVTPEGGESYTVLKSRVLEARDKVLKLTDVGRASAIVSHLQVTRSMLSEALGIPTEEMAGLKIMTASITCVDYHTTGKVDVHFQSYKPDAGLAESIDGAN
jgi:broad specificity phosphatase PhoE